MQREGGEREQEPLASTMVGAFLPLSSADWPEGAAKKARAPFREPGCLLTGWFGTGLRLGKTIGFPVQSGMALTDFMVSGSRSRSMRMFERSIGDRFVADRRKRR